MRNWVTEPAHANYAVRRLKRFSLNASHGLYTLLNYFLNEVLTLFCCFLQHRFKYLYKMKNILVTWGATVTSCLDKLYFHRNIWELLLCEYLKDLFRNFTGDLSLSLHQK